MDFNTLLLRLGLNPENFVNRLNEPIKTETGFIYEVDQKVTISNCPYCRHDKLYNNGYFSTKKNCNSSNHLTDTLYIRRVRLKCRKCLKTFSPPLKGLEPYTKISNQTLQLIHNEFTQMMTFSDIAKKYNVSTARVLQLFDEHVRFVPRRPLPEVLCIDEIRFSKDADNAYVCILYDFHKREIVDVIRNRRMPYLRDYFSEINLIERGKVKIVISDMYDAYSTITTAFFKSAIHIVDTFHVVRLLTNAVNILRTRTMNLHADKASPIYNFMKKNWKLFLARTRNTPDKYYTYKKTGELFHYDELLRRSLNLNPDLYLAYNSLQDLYRYEQKFTYDEALRFIERIRDNLLESSNELLKSTGRSFHKWRFEIANAFSKTQNNIRYTNAIAESINNKIKTITKLAYGYRDFERFRKRVLLILTYGKTP